MAAPMSEELLSQMEQVTGPYRRSARPAGPAKRRPYTTSLGERERFLCSRKIRSR